MASRRCLLLVGGFCRWGILAVVCFFLVASFSHRRSGGLTLKHKVSLEIFTEYKTYLAFIVEESILVDNSSCEVGELPGFSVNVDLSHFLAG